MSKKRAIDAIKGGAVLDAASQEFREYLVMAWAEGRLSAKDASSIAHLATRAGARGVSDLGADPQRRDHARTVTAGLGLAGIDDRLTYKEVPVVLKGDRFFAEVSADPQLI